MGFSCLDLIAITFVAMLKGLQSLNKYVSPLNKGTFFMKSSYCRMFFFFFKGFGSPRVSPTQVPTVCGSFFSDQAALFQKYPGNCEPSEELRIIFLKLGSRDLYFYTPTFTLNSSGVTLALFSCTKCSIAKSLAYKHLKYHTKHDEAPATRTLSKDSVPQEVWL